MLPSCSTLASSSDDEDFITSVSLFLAAKDKSNGLARDRTRKSVATIRKTKQKGEPPSSRHRNYAKITELTLPMTRHDDLAFLYPKYPATA